ncbi:MAG: hypothetical protein I8H71_00340 [Xanthomonadaceae bacterium]|nr:hypothetical protein [Xanthomonadaceae bacterium]MBH2008121.1 hypothetical protein [Xanthomonadaceae bacterium]
MAVQLMSKSAYARHRGCDEKAVRKAISENRISCIDGKIDPAVADIQWAQNTRARAGSGRTAGADELVEGQGAAQASSASMAPAAGVGTSQPGYQDARARRETADAERAEMETAKMAGRLIDRDSTERAIFDAFRQLRDSTMASAPRAAPKVIGMNDARDIERVIADELRKAFQGWETQMLERLPARQVA